MTFLTWIYLLRFLAIILGVWAFRNVWYVSKNEWEHNGKLHGFWLGAISHWILFYSMTLLDAFYPLDNIPFFGKLATPEGAPLWGGIVGVHVTFTLAGLYAFRAEITRQKINRNQRFDSSPNL